MVHNGGCKCNACLMLAREKLNCKTLMQSRLCLNAPLHATAPCALMFSMRPMHPIRPMRPMHPRFLCAPCTPHVPCVPCTPCIPCVPCTPCADDLYMVPRRFPVLEQPYQVWADQPLRLLDLSLSLLDQGVSGVSEPGPVFGG